MPYGYVWNLNLASQLNNIASAPSTYDWTYQTQSSGIRADVSYDIWFGSASSGEPASSASSYEMYVFSSRHFFEFNVFHRQHDLALWAWRVRF